MGHKGKVSLLYGSVYVFEEHLAWHMDGHRNCTHISLVFVVSSPPFWVSWGPLGLSEMRLHAHPGWRK